ncbi:mycofactocin system GMC family oxidoreductase MftG [Rhodococcus sp. 06-235-1A]|uniref:mycofactocin dehydrogenase MftG n=1 Tax=Rhodococcus sp. 06-235-1A TaxID=2022508 RepID=UPI000B9ABF9E|nr:mycofactocin system GMC family oxidoreductase MftG [Rhodococcus sp. 06-235-1A]OZC99295.1 mycofactocin system GMC family oxidoreductase MftG [Rhodococcus sp. 06-235-1A]
MNRIEYADVVVVGGGSCGCVMASRLSENPDRSVLLLEAGPSFSSVTDVPAALRDASMLPIGPGSEWTGTYSAELTSGVGRTIARGRVLGGSGAVNGGYFVRATPSDFDAWPQSVWSFDQVLPFYIGSETDLDSGVARRWHGSYGPMPVARTPERARHLLTTEFMKAAVNAGFPMQDDLNSPDASAGGVGAVPLNIHNGIRVSAALAYLLPILNRQNLRVQGDSTVTSLMFHGSKVIGVESIVDGVRNVVRSDTVILSAGAVHTPALLLRSGIGPADDLVALGISVEVDSPGVGRGFSDHPEVAVPITPMNETPTASPALEAVLHSGDVEIRPYTRRFDRLIAGLAHGPHVVGVGLMRSTSRGSIGLRNTDPFEAPDVVYHYLESDVDRRAMRDGVALARDLLASPSMSSKVEVPSIDDPLAALGTSLHLSGSARMGPESDSTSVLDDHCRVRGVDGLFVVDTSAFPVVPSRGPHATAIMFAERVADLIADHDRRAEA